jgi:biotin-(acetyl-CoA carboxylase) ligase
VYDALLAGNKKSLLDEYRKRLFILGKAVVVRQNETEYEATVTALDENGALAVRGADGAARLLNAGEISLKIVR